MQTFDFVTHITGHVRIDAETVEEAREEFEEQFAHELVLVTATQDQVLVVQGLAWEAPTIYEEPKIEEADDENQISE